VEYPDLSVALQATGFPLSTPRDVVSGSTTAMGIGDGSTYRTQGRKYISVIMNLRNGPSITRHHLRDNIEAHKL